MNFSPGSDLRYCLALGAWLVIAILMVRYAKPKRPSR